MTTRSRAVLLLLAMLWQALAWLTPVQLEQHQDTIAHLVVHAQEVDHHHHADQTLHIDEDGNEPPHQHVNEAVQPPGLPPTLALAVRGPMPSVMVPTAASGHAAAFVEGLLRPPQRGAGPA